MLKEVNLCLIISNHSSRTAAADLAAPFSRPAAVTVTAGIDVTTAGTDVTTVGTDVTTVGTDATTVGTDATTVTGPGDNIDGSRFCGSFL